MKVEIVWVVEKGKALIHAIVERMMRIRRGWYAAAGIGLVVVTGILWLNNDNADTGITKQVAVEVRRGKLRVTTESTGEVRPQNRVVVKPPVAGRIEEILVEEGNHVKKGEELATMSSGERAAILDAVRGKGEDELARWKEIYRATSLIAPLDGIVIARDAEPGQTVNVSDSVLVISDRLIVGAQVDETDIGNIRLGQKVEILLDAYPDNPVGGKVDHIAYEANTVNNVTVYEVEVVPESIPRFMRSGMTANVVFIVASKDDALLVPLDAIKKDSDGSFVVVYDSGSGSGKSQRVDVGLNDGRMVEVTGIREGCSVLVERLDLAHLGTKTDTNPFMPKLPKRETNSKGSQ